MQRQRRFWPAFWGMLVFLLMGLAATDTPLLADDSFDCETAIGLPATECEGLVALYASTDGDNWEKNTGWLSLTNPCRWAFVNCEDGHVKHLLLHDNGLYGTIPADVAKLTGLQQLDLSSNHLSGSIPDELGQIAGLRELNLSDNQLGGELPSALSTLSRLDRLMLNANLLHGPLPLSWTALDLFLFSFQDTQICLPDSAPIVRWLDGIHNLTTTNLSCPVEPIPHYDFSLTAEQTAFSAAPGTTVSYPITLTNDGNVLDSFTVTVDSIWSATAPGVIGPLGAGESDQWTVQIETPDQAMPDAQDIATVTVTSLGDSTVGKTIELVTTIEQRAGVSVTLQPLVDTGSPGSALVYGVAIRNLGNGLDAFTLATEGNWEALLDAIKTDPIEPGLVSTHRMTVTVPVTGIDGESEQVGVTATSDFDPQVSAQEWATATVATSGGATVACEKTSQAGPAGTTVAFSVVVTNQAEQATTFAVEVSGIWPVTLSTNETGELAPGASMELSVQVDIPMDAQLEDKDVVLVTVREGDRTWAAVELTAVAHQEAALLCEPMDQAAAGYPGDAIIYALTVTNTGEGIDSFVLTTSSLWTAAPVQTQTAFLAPDESEMIHVTVVVPSDASAFEKSETTLHLTSHFDPLVADHARFVTRVIGDRFLPLMAR